MHFLARSFFALCTVAVLPLAAFSQDSYIPRDPVLKECKTTPAVGSESYPGAGNIVKSNKPARPAGKAEFPFGQLLYITGIVTDQNCVPLSGVMVDLWQADRNGRYHYADKGELVNPYPVFAGSGRAITDNLGRYSFLTMFPGPYKTFVPTPKPGHYEPNAPHVHFRLVHPDFNSMVTKMYFAGDVRNDEDRYLKKVSAETRHRLEAEIYTRAEYSLGVRRTHDPSLAQLNRNDPAFQEMLQADGEKLGPVNPMNPDDPRAGVVTIFNITLHGKSPFKRF